MNEAAITEYMLSAFPGIYVDVASKESGAPEIAWGDSFFIYNPEKRTEPTASFPFATIVTKDYGEFDNLSNLNRPGVFRLNIGVSKATFQRLFGDLIATGKLNDFDFTAMDRLLPHPVYHLQHWVSILNPSEAVFQSAVQPLLKEAYSEAVRKYAKTAE
jgi:hypothetical protein